MSTYFKSYIIAIYHAKTNKFKFKDYNGFKGATESVVLTPEPPLLVYRVIECPLIGLPRSLFTLLRTEFK